MAEFLKDSEINSKLEDIFRKAEQFLTLFSPYIKLHERIKDILLTHINKPKLQIMIVFGKNKDDLTKSFSKSEFEFIKQFPNVIILYHQRLHAKFYQNDWNSLLTSMNLYDFSQDNNIEFGILTPSSIGRAIKNKLDKDATEYFENVMETCDLVFEKVPKFEKALGGLKSKYTHSEIKVDKLSNLYGLKPAIKKPTIEDKKDNLRSKYKSATALSKILGIQNKDLSEILNKNGWIIRDGKYWKLTPKGEQIGGLLKSGQYGDYIAWPEDILARIDLSR